jgi:hypothetical protein
MILIFSMIYVFILFILFTNNSLFARCFSFKGKNLPSYLINAFAFSLIFYLTYDYVNKQQIESMILFNDTTNNLGTDENVDENENDDDWTIKPPLNHEPKISPPNFEVLPIQCAANYNESAACCNQPPAIIPFENTCSAERPFCDGYIAQVQWGTCGTEKQE